MSNEVKAHKKRSRKSGLPAGSLVHIGEVKTRQPKVTWIDYDHDSLHEQALTTPADIADLLTTPRQGKVLWLNVYGLQDAELLAAIGQHFRLHALTLEDILNTDQRPKLDDYGDYLFLVAHVFDYSSGRGLQSDQVSVVLGRDFVLSFQEQPTGTFEPVRGRLRAEKSALRRLGADHLAYTLLDSLVDRQFAIVEKMSDDAENLEASILGKVPRTRTLYSLHSLKRHVSELRRAVWPLRDMVHVLQRNAAGLLAPDTVLYLRDVYDHTVHVIESLEGLRETLSGSLDIYLSTVSNRMNREVRMLTVITTIFMPATLVAGIFGMNFEQMPLLRHPEGFAFALGIMGGIAMVMLGAFWRRKML